MENQSNVSAGSPIVTSVVKGELTFGSIYKSMYQKEDTLTVELRQVVRTVTAYPTQRVTNNMNATIMPLESFKIKPKTYDSTEERVAWVNVHVDTTEEQAKAAVEAMKAVGACIYRVLSCAPILTKDQEFAMSDASNLPNKRTLDNYADQQVCRYPTKPDASGKVHPQAGQLILDGKGRPMYRKTFFWDGPRNDEDRRDTVAPYLSPAIAAEMVGASVLQRQVI